MRVHIGLGDAEREVEVEIDGAEAFMEELDRAFANGTNLLWYSDPKGRRIGIPVGRIAYVAVEAGESPLTVGFG